MSAKDCFGILMRVVSKSKLQTEGVETKRAPRSSEVKCSGETSTSDRGRPRSDLGPTPVRPQPVMADHRLEKSN